MVEKNAKCVQYIWQKHTSSDNIGDIFHCHQHRKTLASSNYINCWLFRSSMVLENLLYSLKLANKHRASHNEKWAVYILTNITPHHTPNNIYYTDPSRHSPSEAQSQFFPLQIADAICLQVRHMKHAYIYIRWKLFLMHIVGEYRLYNWRNVKNTSATPFVSFLFCSCNSMKRSIKLSH